MSEVYTSAKRMLDAEAFDGFVLTSGTPPGQKIGVMLCLIDKLGKVYAVGVGVSELAAVNALAEDMERRARQWVNMLLIVRKCRRALRIDAENERAEKSDRFLNTQKGGAE